MENEKKKMSNLIILRSLAGLTQTELSKRSGVGIRQIQKMENGESKLDNITLGTVRKLSEVLGCKMSDFEEIEVDVKKKKKEDRNNSCLLFYRSN